MSTKWYHDMQSNRYYHKYVKLNALSLPYDFYIMRRVGDDYLIPAFHNCTVLCYVKNSKLSGITPLCFV